MFSLLMLLFVLFCILCGLVRACSCYASYLPFVMLCLSAISMMFVKIMLAVFMLVKVRRFCCSCCCCCRPTPPPKNGGRVQQPFLRTPADGIPLSNRTQGPLVDWWPISIPPEGAPPPRESSTNPRHVVVCLCWCS